MEIIKKIMMTGSSLCIVIDKVVLDSLKLKKGDLVKVNIKRYIENKNEKR